MNLPFIFCHNQVGTAVWQLLTEPINLAEVVAIFQKAFPDVQSKKIAEDVSTLINEMRDRNLVICRNQRSLV